MVKSPCCVASCSSLLTIASSFLESGSRLPEVLWKPKPTSPSRVACEPLKLDNFSAKQAGSQLLAGVYGRSRHKFFQACFQTFSWIYRVRFCGSQFIWQQPPCLRFGLACIHPPTQLGTWACLKMRTPAPALSGNTSTWRGPQFGVTHGHISAIVTFRD